MTTISLINHVLPYCATVWACRGWFLGYNMVVGIVSCLRLYSIIKCRVWLKVGSMVEGWEYG